MPARIPAIVEGGTICARPNISTVFFYSRALDIKESELNRSGRAPSNLADEEKIFRRSIETALGPNRISSEILSSSTSGYDLTAEKNGD